MSENGGIKKGICLKVPTEIRKDTIQRRGLFLKRDKKQASSRRLLIADAIDDSLYPPPAPARLAQSYTPIAKQVKSANPAKQLDESGRSVVSELTLDASGRVDTDASAKMDKDGSARTVDVSSSKQRKASKSPTRKAKSPKQKTKKSSKSSKKSTSDDDVSVLSDDLSTISEKRLKKSNSNRSVSSKSSKKSTTKKKRPNDNRRTSMKSMGSCQSIDELTVTSGEMSFEGLSIDDSATAESHSTGAPISAMSVATSDDSSRPSSKKKSSKKSKSSKGSKKSVPMIVGSGCGDSDEVSEAEEKPPSLMNSTLSDNAGASATKPEESAVLSQGLQALGQFYE